ncbi:hypothetical protein [Rheinheimera salexigens]|uniref:hypothetical protein n=1 Tax=Rheinheimera salexigens TaxID=1628148 RepID=UPI00114CA7A6|nr:hypothetical protein [Rheinheimera salexigens]
MSSKSIPNSKNRLAKTMLTQAGVELCQLRNNKPLANNAVPADQYAVPGVSRFDWYISSEKKIQLAQSINPVAEFKKKEPILFLLFAACFYKSILKVVPDNKRLLIRMVTVKECSITKFY